MKGKNKDEVEKELKSKTNKDEIKFLTPYKVLKGINHQTQ